MLNTIIHGDCLEVMREIKTGSVDLILTSPPYADLRDYARIKPDDYVEWFLPFAREFIRILKPTGNFILNINDKVVDGERHLFLHELLIRLRREIGFLFVEEYHWRKPNSLGGEVSQRVKRFKRDFEYVYWFAKTQDFTFNPDDVMIPKTTDRRNEFHTSSKGIYKRPEHAQKEMRYPRATLDISPGKGKQGIFEQHSATMPLDLALFFITCGSNKGDTVLDPFAGLATTAVAAIETGRSFICIEKEEKSALSARKRISEVKFNG